MNGESRSNDLKLMVNWQSPEDKVKLVKDIVAIANSGGGEIVIGRTETSTPGIPLTDAKLLDSATISAVVAKYIHPVRVNVAHTTIEISKGRYLQTIQISKPEYPVVFSQNGSFPGRKEPIFRIGEIWTRHSSGNALADSEDIRAWIQEARKSAREDLKDDIRLVTELPEGSAIKVLTSSGLPITSPEGFLQDQVNLRQLNKDHLIEAFYLNWLYVNKTALTMDSAKLALLLASGLRRSSTLYYWLAEADEFPDLIKTELDAAVEAQDRDKSDAANSIVDVGSVYLPEAEMKKLADSLSKSSYSHFRDAGKSWKSNEKQTKKIQTRIDKVKSLTGKPLEAEAVLELQNSADEIARRILEKKSNVLARKLADLNLVIWSKRTKRLK